MNFSLFVIGYLVIGLIFVISVAIKEKLGFSKRNEWSYLITIFILWPFFLWLMISDDY